MTAGLTRGGQPVRDRQLIRNSIAAMPVQAVGWQDRWNVAANACSNTEHSGSPCHFQCASCIGTAIALMAAVECWLDKMGGQTNKQDADKAL